MGVKISELQELTDIDISDILPVVDIENDSTKKIKFETIKNKILEEIKPKLADTGWKDLKFSSDFENYNGTASNNPKYRRIGNIVMLQGIATPVNKTSGDSSELELFTIPEEIRPSKEFYQLCQGTGVNKWLLTIPKNGSVTFSRYGTTDWVSANPGNWLPFNIVYFID